MTRRACRYDEDDALLLAGHDANRTHGARSATGAGYPRPVVRYHLGRYLARKVAGYAVSAVELAVAVVLAALLVLAVCGVQA